MDRHHGRLRPGISAGTYDQGNRLTKATSNVYRTTSTCSANQVSSTGYAYAGDSPTNSTDPTGDDIWGCIVR